MGLTVPWASASISPHGISEGDDSAGMVARQAGEAVSLPCCTSVLWEVKMLELVWLEIEYGRYPGPQLGRKILRVSVYVGRSRTWDRQIHCWKLYLLQILLYSGKIKKLCRGSFSYGL